MQAIPPIIAPISFLKNSILTHAAFWLLVLSSLLVGLINLELDLFWIQTIFMEFICYILFTYPILKIVIPQFLYKKKVVGFFILSLFWVLCVNYINYSVTVIIAKGHPKYAPYLNDLSFFSNIPIFFLFLFLTSAIKIGKDLLIVQYNYELAEKQKTQHELKFLKSQLSPHFLLNTMNNLYGLSVLKSDELPNLILQLSDLLRFTIYDTKQDTVALKDEIQYLKDYIALQKIRLNTQDNLKINFPELIPHKKIVPLILVVFIENAFKHSQEIKNSSDAFLDFRISIENEYLYFTSTNSFEENENQKNDELEKDGVGLENTLRRIELLCGTESIPKITKSNGLYTVNIKLKLHD